MDKPLVSVIIPTYNVEQFIGEAIDSVLAQTYPHIEIIVTDDGSTDQTIPIVQTYAASHKDKLKLVTSPVNTGISSNFNRGLAARTGEFIAWLGGDDLMFPEKIGKQVELLRRRPEVTGCCHDAIVFRSEDGKDLGLFSELYSGRKGLTEGGIELFFNPGYKMLPSTMMIRSASCPSHGFDERLKFVNDILFDIEVFRQGWCAVIQEVLGKYRRHGKNITESPMIKEAAFEENLMLLGIVQARYPELGRLARKRRLVLTMTEAVRAYSQNDRFRYGHLLGSLYADKSRLRAVGTRVFCILFGSSVSTLVNRPTHAMPHWFVRLINIVRRNL
jgi:glycosyltransferase involved in cell wall biosynthesis